MGGHGLHSIARHYASVCSHAHYFIHVHVRVCVCVCVCVCVMRLMYIRIHCLVVVALDCAPSNEVKH